MKFLVFVKDLGTLGINESKLRQHVEKKYKGKLRLCLHDKEICVHKTLKTAKNGKLSTLLKRMIEMKAIGQECSKM